MMPLRQSRAIVALILIGGLHRQNPPAQTPMAPPPPPTGVITGRIVDAENGLPVAGVVVSLSGRPAASASPQPMPLAAQPRMLTDSEGRFFFRDLAAGIYSLATTKPGWVAGAFGRRRPAGPSDQIELTDGERRDGVTVLAWRSAIVSGRIADETGDPLVGVDVRAVQLSWLAGRRQTALVGRSITDDRGAYRFATLIPGEYLIVVPANVTSEPTAFPNVIRAAGQMPRTYYQTMTTAAAAPTSFDRSEMTTANDRWAIATLPGVPTTPPAAGVWPTFVTTFFPSTTMLESAAVVRAVSGEDQSGIDIVVKLTTTFQIIGTLTGPDGPAANHAVHLLQAGSAAASPLFDAATSITDGSGAFRFFGVAPGQYVARVVRVPWPTNGRMAIIGGTGALKSIGVVTDGPTAPPPGQSGEPLLFASQSITVSDSDRSDVQLILRPGPRIRGHIEYDGTAERPNPDALRTWPVLIEPADGSASTFTSGRVAPDNQFLANSVAPGRYLIRGGSLPNWTFESATYRGRDVSETPIDVTDDLDDVVVTYTDHPPKIGGTVQTSDGKPGYGAVVILFPIDPAAWIDHGRSSRRVRLASVTRTGSFSLLTPPPPGDYAIIAIPEEQSVNWQNPEILRKLLAMSGQITIVANQPFTRALQVKALR